VPITRQKTPVLFNCFIADPVIVDHAVLLNIQVLIILQQENYELMGALKFENCHFTVDVAKENK
jgi:hypothetical protein